MAETKMKKHAGPLEFLEKGVVFRVSRTFFWVLCGAAFIALIAACVVCAVNLVPPTKQTVPDPVLPPQVSITLADVNEAMAARPRTPADEAQQTESQDVEQAGTARKPAKAAKPPDPLLSVLNAKLDTLRALFPASKYNWTAAYRRVPVGFDRWGVARDFSEQVTDLGIGRYVSNLLDFYGSQTEQKITVIEELRGIVAQVPIDSRGKALQAYVRVRTNRDEARNREVSNLRSTTARKRGAAEANYESEKASKSSWVQKSVRAIGAAFVSIAVIGLFLCLLAIERNTRMLSALLERDRTDVS